MYRVVDTPPAARSFASLVPWYLMPSPTTVQNKDGAFMRSYALRGVDIESLSPSEQVLYYAQINDVLRSSSLGSGWGEWWDSWHLPTVPYPEGDWPHGVPRLIDAVRRERFKESSALHFETHTTLSLLWKPPPHFMNKVESYIFTDADRSEEISASILLDRFESQAAQIAKQFALRFAAFESLEDTALLQYLHSTISLRQQEIAMPEIAVNLDHLLCDMDGWLGIPFGLGTDPSDPDHPRPEYVFHCISPRTFPVSIIPALMAAIDNLPFPCRYFLRRLPMDKADALKKIAEYENRWGAQLFSMGARVWAYFTGEKNQKDQNAHVTELMNDMQTARLRIERGDVSLAYESSAVIVWDRDPVISAERASVVEALLRSLGLTCYRETINAASVFLSGIPGNTVHNVRRPLIVSSNTARRLPVSAPWNGPLRDEHLQAPVLMHTRTTGNNTFRFSLHHGDVGHIAVIGPSGMGKTVKLNLMAAQFQRYPRRQVFGFDKDFGFKVLTKCVGGSYYNLRSSGEGGAGFQPYAQIDASDHEQAWAAEWTEQLFYAQRGEPLTPAERAEVWRAIQSLATMPLQTRTMTGLRGLIQDYDLRQMLTQYTLDGPYGSMFDADKEELGISQWTIFETGDLLESPLVARPTFTYIFHRMSQCFTGAPTLVLMAEAYRAFDDPLFLTRFKTGIKEYRRKNVSLIFEVQSIGDFLDHPIAPTIIDNCLQKVFLANPAAADPEGMKYYLRLGLSEAKARIVANLIAKEQYYLTSPAGDSPYSLDLDEVQKAFCASSWKEDLAAIDELEITAEEPLDAAWLRYKGIDWAADILAEDPSEPLSGLQG